MEFLSLLMGGVDCGERGPEFGGGKPTGVAVGDDVGTILEEFRAKTSHGMAHGAIFLMDRAGLEEEGGEEGGERGIGIGLIERAGHAIESPEEVDGGRAALGELLDGLAEMLMNLVWGEGSGFAGSHADTVGGSDADGRSAADAEGADGFDDLVNGGAVKPKGLFGELGLVEQFQAAAVCLDPFDGAWEGSGDRGGHGG